jgi:hypothetical protein
MTAVTPQGKPSEPPDRPTWPLIATVGLAAAVLGYLLGAAGTNGDPVGGAETTSTIVSPEPTSPATTTTVPRPREPSLAELVPGFEGTLVAQLGQQHLIVFSGPRLAVWPAQRDSPMFREQPIMVVASPDASGTLMAGLGPVAMIGWSALYVGRPESMRPVRHDVSSYAWHSTQPGHLAWLEFTDDPGHYDLMVADMPAEESQALLSPGRRITEVLDARLHSWGQWGFLLVGQLGEEVILLDENGDERWRHQATNAHVAASGDMLLSREPRWGDFSGLLLIPAGSLDTGDAIPLAWIPERTAAVGWSPDSLRLALAVRDPDSRCCDNLILHIEVRTIEGTLLSSQMVRDFNITHVATPSIERFDGESYLDEWWTSEIRWTPDGRFVIVAGVDPMGPGRVLLYDTTDLVLHEVAFPSQVHRAFVRQP